MNSTDHLLNPAKYAQELEVNGFRLAKVCVYTCGLDDDTLTAEMIDAIVAEYPLGSMVTQGDLERGIIKILAAQGRAECLKTKHKE